MKVEKRNLKHLEYGGLGRTFKISSVSATLRSSRLETLLKDGLRGVPSKSIE